MAKRVVHKETMCCGYKKCPKVRIFSDGSIEVSDDDAKAGSVGTVKFKPRAAKGLKSLLNRRGARA